MEHSNYFDEVRQTGEFRVWLGDLRDRRANAIVTAKLARLIASGTGDIRSIGAGLSELRIHFGPGYRVYFRAQGRRLLLLLVGGDKDDQKRDIRHAQQLAAEHDAA